MKTLRILSILVVLSLVVTALSGCPPQTTVAPQPTPTSPPPEATPTSPPSEAKDLLDEITEAGKLLVSTDPNYAPQSFLNDAGELDGFDVNVAQEVAKRLGVEVEFVTPDWDIITAGNWGGRWDVSIGSMTPTEARSEVLWFTDPYYYTPASFAVHNDNTTIATPEDLAGKTVGLGTATTYEDYLNGVLVMLGGEVMYDPPSNVDVKPYSTDAEAIQDLALGDGVRLDAVMSAQPTIQNAIDEGLPLKYVGTPAFYEPLAFSLDKKRGPSDKALAKFNEVIAAMHADGTLSELSMKWYGVDITKMVEPAEAVERIIIGTTDKPATLDPADCYGFPGWEFTHQIADGLLNNVPGTSGELELGLAAEWPTVSDDGLEWTFKLREGVTFPDGTPFNADAVIFAIQDRVIGMEETLAGEVAFLVSAYVDHVEKLDDYTVKFVLPAPVGFFPQLVATNPYKIVNPNTWSTEEYQADNYSGGIGRYVCTSWKRDEEAIFERNETYYGTPAVADKVIVRYFADAAAMALALENGEIDVAWKTLLPADLDRLSADPNFVVEQGPGTEIRYVCYQCQTEPFNDARVRQALALCLDRAQIADVGFQGTKVPLFSMIPPGFLGYEVFYPEEPDLEQAKSLLSDAGFDESNPLVMDLWWSPDHYGDTEADVVALIKDQYEATGVIQVNLQSAEWATYKQYRNAGSLPVYLLGWYPDYLDPDNYTWPFAHSSATQGIGTYYSNPDMDALLEQAQVETDDDTRAELYKQVEEMWFEENPTTPFAQGALYIAYAQGVTGVTLDPLMQLHYFLIGK
jgi:peptide/nickel transport system substrate-binding protein